MKCPKCGFNSFEFYDSCKKCSSDLIGYKQTYSITSMVLPQEAKEKLAAEFRSTESTTDQSTVTHEAHDDIFSFDLPDEIPPSSGQRNDDPFNFDEPASGVNQTNNIKSEDDVFADLLESTSQSEDSPFAAESLTEPPAHAALKTADSTSVPGEFDLESFSWEDTSVAPASDNKDAADDFDALFGDTKDKSSK